MSDTAAPSPTIILAEADADLRQALQYSLEIDGFNVVACASGETLLELSLPPFPACLVVDQRLPGISGIEALEILRGRDIDLPAIMVAGAPDARLRARLLLANASLVEKPLLNDRLAGAIRGLL